LFDQILIEASGVRSQHRKLTPVIRATPSRLVPARGIVLELAMLLRVKGNENPAQQSANGKDQIDNLSLWLPDG
jgi:hypothetical protein